MVSRIIEGTILLVIVYLVLANAFGFTQVVKSLSAGYSGVVQTLQARDNPK